MKNFFASDDTKVLPIEENGIELKVVTDVSKRTFNTLVKQMPQDIDAEKGFTPGQATEFTSALFVALVRGWNLDRPATLESYLDMKREVAETIDEALGNYFTSLTPDVKESSKSA